MINLGTQRTEHLLQHIAREIFHQPSFNPPWKAVHIAGTNGKGSVAAYASSLLRHCLLRQDGQPMRVGRFTSPHLIDRWDCITIDDKPVSQEVFDNAEKQVLSVKYIVSQELKTEALERNAKDGVPHLDNEELRRISEPTQFELLTATAFTIFSMPNPTPCDVAVIECGIGGAEDATNALPDSAIGVSVLTRIGLDHLGILGNGIQDIVRHKAGIARRGVKVIVDGSNTEAVKQTIKANIVTSLMYTCDDKVSNQAVLIPDRVCLADPQQLQQAVRLSSTDNNQDTKFLDIYRDLMEHQRSNLAAAHDACEEMLRLYQNNPNEHLQCNSGSSSLVPGTQTHSQRWIHPDILRLAVEDAGVSYPARLQVLKPGWLDPSSGQLWNHLNKCTLLLDGAHNEQSAQVLRQKVRLMLDAGTGKSRDIIWILAMSSTKPPADILNTLLASSIDADQGVRMPDTKHEVIFTTFSSVDGMPWVKPSTTQLLVKALESMKQRANFDIVGETKNVSEALEESENLLARNHQDNEARPLIVVAGSLYLASDFLRLMRDRREAFR